MEMFHEIPFRNNGISTANHLRKRFRGDMDRSTLMKNHLGSDFVAINASIMRVNSPNSFVPNTSV